MVDMSRKQHCLNDCENHATALWVTGFEMKKIERVFANKNEQITVRF
jgi:hypothetical protein